MKTPFNSTPGSGSLLCIDRSEILQGPAEDIEDGFAPAGLLLSTLPAEAEEAEPTSTAVAAGRSGASFVYAGRYRVLAANVIEATDRGHVDFAVPRLRGFLHQTPVHSLRVQRVHRE